MGTIPDRLPITAYFTDESLPTTSALIFSPRQHTVRILESVDLRDGLIERQTTIELSVPPEKVIVPIAFPWRGTLIDTFKIEATPGVEPSTLGRRETRAVMTRVLQSMASVLDAPADIKAAVREMCGQLLVLEAERGEELIEQARKTVEAVMRGELTPDQRGVFDALAWIAGRTPLLIPCDPKTAILKISFTSEISDQELRLHGPRETTRSVLGRLPDSMVFDLPLANRTRSYHFRLHAPVKHYVRSVSCRARVAAGLARTYRIREHEWTAFTAPDVLTGDHADATGLCHVRLIDAALNQQAQNGLLLRVQLSEEPLGQLGGATLRLGLALAGTVALAAYGSRIVTTPSLAITSLLIALPGLTGVSLLATKTDGGIRGPLLARFGNISAAVASVWLALMFTAWTITAQRVAPETKTEYPMPNQIATGFWLLSALLVGVGLACSWALVSNLRAYHTARMDLYSRRRDTPIDI